MISLPVNFSVRAFFFTNVIRDLLKKNKVAIVSPLCQSKSFRNNFKFDGLSFHKHFEYKEHHPYCRNWLNRLDYVSRLKWKLYTPNHTDRLLYYLKNKTSLEINNSSNKTIKRKLLDYLINTKIIFPALYFIENKLFNIFNQKIIKQYKELLKNINPDLVIATAPFITNDIPLMKTVNKMKIPSAFFVLSYDNITSRPPLTVFFDNYFVWNSMNKDELINQYDRIDESQIKICGPIQFDWHQNKMKYLKSKKEWFLKSKLDVKRKTILFGTNVEKASPHDQHVVQSILNFNKNIGLKFQIIIRLHPNDKMERWKNFSESDNSIAFSLSSYGNSFINENITSLINDICHSDVIVSNGTSIALDAIRLKKPAIFFAFDDRYPKSDPKSFDKLAKDIYKREHIVPLIKFGGVKLVHSFTELKNEIVNFINNSNINSLKQHETVKYYDPYCDGNASGRFVKYINDFIDDLN